MPQGPAAPPPAPSPRYGEPPAGQQDSRSPRKRAAVATLAPSRSGTAAAGISRRTVAIAAATLVLLVALTVGGLVVYGQAQAPAAIGQQFCNDLQTQSYTQAYQLLGTQLRAHMSVTQLAADATTLDRVEGKVTSCSADSSGYVHGPFDKTATAAYDIVRAQGGVSEGTLTLKTEAGGWRVEGIGTALLGANLGAVQAVNSYCAALTGQHYADAYALLDAKAQAATKQGDYVQVAQWHDALDGQLIVCTLTGIGTGQSDTAANFTLTVTRTVRGDLQGIIALAVEGGAWRITSVAASLQGTETAPLLAAQRFCTDLGGGNYADIYAMATAAYLNGESEAQLAADLSGKSFDVKWASCTLLDVSGYKLQGAQAYVNVEYQAQQLSSGYSWKPQGTLEFVKQGDLWLLNSRQGLH